MTITAEDWVRRIEEVLDKFNLSKEEYWKPVGGIKIIDKFI